MLRHIVLGLLGCAVVSPLPADPAPLPKLSLLKDIEVRELK